MAKSESLTLENLILKLSSGEQAFLPEKFATTLAEVYRDNAVVKSVGNAKRSDRERAFVAATIILGGVTEANRNLAEQIFKKSPKAEAISARESTSMKLAVLLAELNAAQALLAEQIEDGSLTSSSDKVSEVGACQALKAAIYVHGCYASFLATIGIEDGVVPEKSVVEYQKILSSAGSIARQVAGDAFGASVSQVISEATLT